MAVELFPFSPRHLQCLTLAVAIFAAILCRLPCAHTLNLDGSPGSYVEYPPWEPCLNGSFSFEFRTSEPLSLLLYLNRGSYSYFEVKLLKGGIRLRMNLGERTMIIRAGQNLNDNKWHSVEVVQDGDLTTLIVDGIEHSKTSSGLLHTYNGLANETFLYLGGLPMEYESKKFNSLALPSVIFEPKFRGSVRNFFYRSCGGEAVRPQPLSSAGLLTTDVDLCERGNPCLNGGRCLTTDNGVLCDCTATEYRGDRCDIQKIPSDATFMGTQYFSYNLSSRGDVMVDQDRVRLDFRTKQANSLLFYTGNSKDYMTVGLMDGAVFLTINLGSGMYQAEIRPSGTRFDDNRWHQLLIQREARELPRDAGVCFVTMELDGMYRKQGSITGKFIRLSSNLLYVAGSPNTETLPGSRVRTNFKGCLRKVRYRADGVLLDLTDLARREHSLMQVTGDVIFDKCQELVESHPVTFTSPESHLTIPTWSKPGIRGSLAFQFRTVEPGGLMMYSNGGRDSKDFFALELLDGHLYLVLDMGSGILKIQASKLPVSDGRPHDVYFEFKGYRGDISVDGQKVPFASGRVSDRFDLHGFFYVGGLGSEINASLLPRELWAVMLGLSYVGCLQDLVLDGSKVDLLAAARLQNKSDVAGYCKQTEPQCVSHPCNHGGKCVEGWNRFSCDCRATGFVGAVCQTAAATLQFDGTQFMKVTMSRESVTQAEDVSLRFRSLHPSGLLFLTTGGNDNRMQLFLQQGTLFLSVNVGSGSKVLSVGHRLNDDRWHTVFIRRRVQTVELAIDSDRPVIDQLPGSTFSLATNYIFVGHKNPPGTEVADLPGRARELGLSSVEAGHMVQDDSGAGTGHSGSDHSGFIGSMQAFIFNNNHFFQMAKSGTGDNIEISARFSSDEYVVRDPVTFKSVDAFAILPTLQAHEEFSVSLQLKTTESDGLILYNGGNENDFFALELFQGFLYYVYNMGEGAQRVKANVQHPINDNKWHEARIFRVEKFTQLLRVDDNTPTVDDLTGTKNNRFDLDGFLYIGGVRKTMYPSLPKLVYSRHGFVGCLGSLNLNGYLPNVLREANPIHESVGDGCRGPMSKCVNDSCANQGRCVQQWTSYKCDCDMTSFTGPMCKDESVSYKFGPGPGLMTFAHLADHEPSTNFDNLAFGFKTFLSDAILLRMDSRAYDDFIQIELADGYVYLVYNMGSFDHPLGDFYHKVNDGQYHVVRFTRAGPNATLQIDADMPQTKHPTGKQAHTFNNQAFVRIGGTKVENGSITQHFEGIISGLVLNGINVFELAKHEDPKVRLEGSVSLNQRPQPGPFRPPQLYTDDEDLDEMQSTQGHTTPRDGVTDDDIIQAGAGSGCQFDNSEDCSAVGSGIEEIITPVVIVKTTTPPPTTTPKPVPKCQGEGCETSSQLRQRPDPSLPSSTLSPSGSGHDYGGDGGGNGDIDYVGGSGEIEPTDNRDGYHGHFDKSTTKPGKTTDDDDDDDGVNLVLILGITGSVLLAVIVLCIVLCKLRGRDEGTYKVDETQNFSALQSKKSQGNGSLASGGESCTGKRGKKKDVKEWYV
ncbi:neurexin [Aplysia californica]|uniref:Neurexin n=1 Tax=Aplysia californica TaxID=6500 RepID=G0WLR9_APLCA|nr:neurexin [Aplysia californica]ADM64537.1 neurexin [Aplysia californica]